MLKDDANPQLATDASDSVHDVIAEVGRMTALAGIGEWQQVEITTKRIQGLVENLPASHRHACLVAVRNGIEHATALAIDAQSAIATELAAVRQGRHAAARYHATGAFRDRP